MTPGAAQAKEGSNVAVEAATVLMRSKEQLSQLHQVRRRAHSARPIRA
jgi:hypothetical protein